MVGVVNVFHAGKLIRAAEHEPNVVEVGFNAFGTIVGTGPHTFGI